MLKEPVTDAEEAVLRYKFFDHNSVFHEYETIVKVLKEELCNCKAEQSNLRLEIQNLRAENQSASENLQHLLTEYNHDSCKDDTGSKEVIANLEKQVTVLQMEKDSVVQLWQMALKSIDVLEEELKTCNREDKNVKHYQEQVYNVKETYSEAIKMLEAKLTEARENHFQQQVLWEKNKDKIDQLSKEKDELVQQLHATQQQILEREKQHEKDVETLKENWNCTKGELEQVKKLKDEVEEKLKDAQKFVNTMITKDYEAKSKVTEAVILVESAVKEKEDILRREARILEEKMRLETCLTKLTEECTSRFEKEISKAKEMYDKNVKKYILEIKELKAELREKSTIVDRSQRECKLIEEELERMRLGSDNFAQKSCFKISNLEQKIQEKDYKLQSKEEHIKVAYDNKIHFLENQVTHLQEKLSNTSDKLRRINMQSCREVEDHVREADDRTREIMDKCLNFERQLSRALIDKDNLASNLHILEVSFDKELQKRNQEKLLLENKIRDLQEKVVNTEVILNEPRIFSNIIERKTTGQQTLMNFESISNILAIQEKYDKKTKELTQLVETHQQLSNKWKEEANLLTSKFEKRSQELKNKISALQKQNDDLARELLFYQQLLARCNAHMVQNYNADNEAR